MIEYKETYQGIKPCPVCGKVPKIYRDIGYEECGFGAWCTIQCKPLLRKPHLKIEERKASWERALAFAVDHWNLYTTTGITPDSAAAAPHDRQKTIADEIHELMEDDTL